MLTHVRAGQRQCSGYFIPEEENQPTLRIMTRVSIPGFITQVERFCRLITPRHLAVTTLLNSPPTGNERPPPIQRRAAIRGGGAISIYESPTVSEIRFRGRGGL